VTLRLSLHQGSQPVLVERERAPPLSGTKKLIEVALPHEAINRDVARERLLAGPRRGWRGGAAFYGALYSKPNRIRELAALASV
jgi:hypothetical protein